MTRSLGPRKLFISNIEAMSGAEWILLEHLRHAAAEAHVIAPPGPFLMALQDAGLSASGSAMLRELHREANPLWPAAAIRQLFGSALEIRATARRYGPEVLIANNLGAGAYCVMPARLLKRPWIWLIYDIHPPESLEARTVRTFSRSAAALIAASEAVRRNLETSISGNTPVHVLYNGVDTRGRFDPSVSRPHVLRRELGLPEDAPLVGFIGQLAPHKGPQLLVEIAERLFCSHGAHLVFIGTAPPKQRDFGRDLVQDATGSAAHRSIHFLGHRDPAELLHELTVVAVPSIFPDPLPTVVLEAMSMRKEVVAAEVGGIPEMIQHGDNGFLVPEGDAEALLNQLQRVLDQPSERVRGAARETVRQRFSLENKVRTFDALIDGVLQEWSSRSST